MQRKSFYKTKREKPEFDQKIIDIRRVARVVAGGRRFSFRVTIVIGDRKGRVGVGLGKGADTALAIDKAVHIAKKNLVKIPLTKNNSIPYEVEAKFTCAEIIIRPAREGRGLVAGSSVRVVLDLAGVKDVAAKVISRSKNKLNIARATISALQKLK
ncbi:30S ribosomal protein S5 [Patescibacteria group bacterium]|nr:30S ribosomal protein S5 [Patescibacteria group bacterium]